MRRTADPQRNNDVTKLLLDRIAVGDTADATLVTHLQALARVPERDAYLVLMKLCKHPSPAVLDAALIALHKNSEPGSISGGLFGETHARVLRRLPWLVESHPELGAGLLVTFFRHIHPSDVEQRMAYLRAMIAVGDPSAAREVVKQLDTPYDDLLLAMIDALRYLGDLECARALEAMAADRRRGRSIRKAARAAVDVIVQRAEAKSLSGALSLSDGTAGGLSLPRDPSE
jgi:hypothetical protein